MHLQLIRKTIADEHAAGELFIEGVFECFTLEKPPKTSSVIPNGEYQVSLCSSHKRLNVKSSVADACIRPEGLERSGACRSILVIGKSEDSEEVMSDGKEAFRDLSAKIERAIGRGEEVFLTIAS